MTTPNKKRIYQAAAIAVTAEAIIGIALILIPALTVFEKLKIFGGIFIIIKSAFLFVLLNNRLKDEKLLRLSVFSFPVMTSFFAGLALLVSVWPSFDWLINICEVGLVLSILIGGIMRRYSLRQRKIKEAEMK